jgi:signal peptidase II
MKLSSASRLGLAAATIIVALDQLTKWIIVYHVMMPPRRIEVTSFFNLVMGWNRGVSFGLFSNDSQVTVWILSFVAIAIITWLTVWLLRATHRLLGLGLGLVIGGALGNLIDRLRFSAVADFLDFHVAGFHWPAFNVADTAITVGAICLLVETLFLHDKRYTDSNDGSKKK